VKHLSPQEAPSLALARAFVWASSCRSFLLHYWKQSSAHFNYLQRLLSSFHFSEQIMEVNPSCFLKCSSRIIRRTSVLLWSGCSSWRSTPRETLIHSLWIRFRRKLCLNNMHSSVTIKCQGIQNRTFLRGMFVCVQFGLCPFDVTHGASRHFLRLWVCRTFWCELPEVLKVIS
jgi:hypothetical protein